MTTCLCCNSHKLNDNYLCINCGYQNVVILEGDDSTLSEEMKDADAYRTQVVSSLNNFHVMGYAYDLVDTGINERERPVFKLGDGLDAYETFLWCKEQFAQCHDEPIQTLSIQYEYNSKPQTVEVKIDIPKTDDFWRLGIEVTSTLRLNVYLGLHDEKGKPFEDNRTTKTPNIDILLKASEKTNNDDTTS